MQRLVLVVFVLCATQIPTAATSTDAIEFVQAPQGFFSLSPNFTINASGLSNITACYAMATDATLVLIWTESSGACSGSSQLLGPDYQTQPSGSTYYLRVKSPCGTCLSMNETLAQVLELAYGNRLCVPDNAQMAYNSTFNCCVRQIDIAPGYPYDGLYLYGHFVNGTQLSATRAQAIEMLSISCPNWSDRRVLHYGQWRAFLCTQNFTANDIYDNSCANYVTGSSVIKVATTANHGVVNVGPQMSVSRRTLRAESFVNGDHISISVCASCRNGPNVKFVRCEMEFMSSQTLAAYYGGNNVFTGFVLAPNGSAYMYFDGTPIPDPYFTLLYSQVSGAYPLIAINNNLQFVGSQATSSTVLVCRTPGTHV